jgi:serine/threonine protein kinase
MFSRGDVIAGKYEVDKVLGSGLIGTTYLVRNQKSRKFLAVKVIQPQLVATDRDRQRFNDIYEEAKPITGPGLIKLGSMGESDGCVYFSEEFFPSQNLRELIDEYQAEQRSFTLQEACQIAIKVLEAVEVLHKANAVHRNLKPENVLVSTRKTGPGGKNLVRTIKVSDGMLSDLVNPTIFAESYISRADAKYLAPEMNGFNDITTPAADIYSVGVMLYELLVGQPPRGTYLSPTQLRGDLPAQIDDVIELALGETPEERYPSARDMINGIQRSFHEEEELGPIGPDVKKIVFGVGVGVVLLGALGLYFGNRDQPTEDVSAAAQDDAIRRKVQAANRVLTEAEIQKMIESHPEMQYIPEGPFVMGRLHRETPKTSSSSEPLASERTLPSFYIDRFEHPNMQKGPDGSAPKPTLRYTWEDAEAACKEQGKRLCTEEEWEKACKGPDNYIYAYGDTFDETLCGKSISGDYRIGSLKDCISGYGVYGMSGGPREWTSTTAGKGSSDRRVVKGGMRANHTRGSRCAYALDESARYADATLSFRCCLSAGDAPAPTEEAPQPSDAFKVE